MAVFYLISILSILIVFIVPCIIGTRYMIKNKLHGTFRFFGYY